MNQINKIINDDPETLRAALTGAKMTLGLCAKKRPEYRKRELAGFLVVLLVLLLGLASRETYIRIPSVVSACLLIIGSLSVVYSLWYGYQDSLLFGAQLVCKRCIPQAEKYLELTSNYKISEITYTKSLKCIVTITAETPSGEKASCDMECARKLSSDVQEATLDVGKMTVYFPESK